MPMELSRTLEGSLQFMNILECPTLFYVQAYIQETSRFLQKALDPSHAFYHSVELCGLLQAFLEPSTLFPLVAKCGCLQGSLEASHLLYKPWGGSFEASCDIMPYWLCHKDIVIWLPLIGYKLARSRLRITFSLTYGHLHKRYT